MTITMKTVLCTAVASLALVAIGCTVPKSAAADTPITPTIVYTVQKVDGTTVTTFRAGAGVSSRMCTLVRETYNGRVSVALDCN